ncbi:uncharacterized protein LOC125930440 [Panthera uncia]|uniref:uncharacterized protein LOC125930440 n=1 Tax=Panthera uncia TaxID=29064 RepID=UPI0020FF8734|nr:uncharacterized protein LOC125930440 [Panthera uncia]
MTAGECKWLARLSRLPPLCRRLRAEAPGAAAARPDEPPAAGPAPPPAPPRAAGTPDPPPGAGFEGRGGGCRHLRIEVRRIANNSFGFANNLKLVELLAQKQMYFDLISVSRRPHNPERQPSNLVPRVSSDPCFHDTSQQSRPTQGARSVPDKVLLPHTPIQHKKGQTEEHSYKASLAIMSPSRHSERTGFAPASPRPRGVRRPPRTPRPRRLQAGRHVVALSPAGRRGRGPQRREHLAEQRLRSRRGSAAAAAAAAAAASSPGCGSRAADPDPTIPKPTRTAELRLHARSQTQRGPRRPPSPEARGGDVAIQSSPRPSDTKPTLRGPSAFLCFIIVFQAARVVIFTLGREPRGAHVGSRWGRGEGAAGLCCKSLSFCGRCSHSPPTAPLHPGFLFFFLSLSLFLSAAQLLWVTRAVAMGYRTEAGWLATCHPVAAAAAAGGAPGREEAGARVYGTRRGGVCAGRRGAAANGRPRVQRRERHRQWGGGKAIKKTQRSPWNFGERENDHYQSWRS